MKQNRKINKIKNLFLRVKLIKHLARWEKKIMVLIMNIKNNNSDMSNYQ